MNAKEPVSVKQSVQLVLRAFAAVERRDEEAFVALCHPEVEFHWPRSLPFGGSSRGGRMDRAAPTWSEVWEPLQPTEDERRMSPRVVAATGDEVVVLWRQRAVSQSGEHFDGEVLGLYGVRDGKFARAQMFYFDTVAVLEFLHRANSTAVAAPSPAQ